MSALDLARAQFALTTALHFLFVLLTLGLVLIVAICQTRYTVRGDELAGRQTRFWGRLYVINYAVGIASGLVMEFQFGLNWGGLTRIAGDVFGAPLALETLIAFVLESTFLGMWIFGWGRLPKRLHLALIWGVVLTAYLSAFWVLVSNAFLQHPVGYEMVAGTARLTSFGALLTNNSLWFALLHVAFAGILTGGFFVLSVSAWHLLRRTEEQVFFRRSMRLGAITAVIGTFLVIGVGYAQFGPVNADQPTKLATGTQLATAQADLVHRFGPGDYRPPDLVHGAFNGMVQSGNLLFLLAVLALVLQIRGLLFRLRPALWVLVVVVPVPYLTAIGGWLVREVGRQPWAVYGLVRTSDAVSAQSAGTLRASLIGFVGLLLILAALDWWLLARTAARGPGDEFLPLPDDAPEPVEVFSA